MTTPVSDSYCLDDLEKAIQISLDDLRDRELLRRLTFDEQLRLAEELSRNDSDNLSDKKDQTSVFEEEMALAQEMSKRDFQTVCNDFMTLDLSFEEQLELVGKMSKNETHNISKLGNNNLSFDDQLQLAEKMSQTEAGLYSRHDSGFSSEDREMELALQKSCDPLEQQDEELRQLLVALQNSKQDLKSSCNEWSQYGTCPKVSGSEIMSEVVLAGQSSNPTPSSSPSDTLCFNDRLLLKSIETKLSPTQLNDLKEPLNLDELDFINQFVKSSPKETEEVKSLDELDKELDNPHHHLGARPRNQHNNVSLKCIPIPFQSNGLVKHPRKSATAKKLKFSPEQTNFYMKSTSNNSFLQPQHSLNPPKEDFKHFSTPSPILGSENSAFSVVSKRSSSNERRGQSPWRTVASKKQLSIHSNSPSPNIRTNQSGKTSKHESPKLLRRIHRDSPDLKQASNNSNSSSPEFFTVGNVMSRATPDLISYSSVVKNSASSGNSAMSGKLRPIVVDGCNVAYQHGKNDRYSARGLLSVYDYFVTNYGYSNENITIVNKPGGKKTTEDLDIIDGLYKTDVLINTPRRFAGNKVIASDDDLFMLNLAKDNGGIVVSLDHFRDAYERTNDPKLKDVIENRILQFVFKGDEIYFPDDPLGSGGPTLDQFLRF